MATDNPKEFVHRFVDEIWNQGNLDKLEEFVQENFQEYRPEGHISGIDSFRQLVALFRNAYPDLNVELHDVIAAENCVAGNYTVEGTLENDFGNLEATNENIRIDGNFFSRLEDGKFVETWNQYDLLNLMIQLGVIAPPEELQPMDDLLDISEGEAPGTQRRPGV